MKLRPPRAPQMAIPMLHDRELTFDFFAGGGGASLGFEMAGVHVDVAINHSRSAIAMHSANHRHTRHYTEDVHLVDPYAATCGRPIGAAWFSPDCTHFSQCLGGKPRDKNVRSLADVVVDTVTTKDRFALVAVAGTEYAIADIGQRMLVAREQLRAQGFPDSYIIDPILDGKPLTKTAQSECAGNSVCPDIVRRMVEANYMPRVVARAA